MEFNATFLISAISFIIFVFIMNAIFYEPVINIIEKRKKFIEDNENEAANADTETESIKETKQKELAQVKSEAASTVTKGSEDLKQRQKIETDNFAREQKMKLEEVKKQLYFEAEESKQQLTQSAEDISRIISEKILGGKNA